MFQSSVIPVYRKNHIQKNNTRNLRIAYLLGFLILLFIGVVGYIGILGKKAVNPNTILDYFSSDNIFVLLVSIMVSFFLICIQPLIIYISRN
jgi:hypothetical protein